MLAGIWAVTETALRMFWRDKHALFWGVVFPLMLMGLIGSVFSNVDDLTLRTAVVVPTPGNPLADGVLAALREVPVLEITIEEEEAALAALRRGERSLVVVLPDQEAVRALAGAFAPFLGLKTTIILGKGAFHRLPSNFIRPLINRISCLL